MAASPPEREAWNAWTTFEKNCDGSLSKAALPATRFIFTPPRLPMKPSRFLSTTTPKPPKFDLPTDPPTPPKKLPQSNQPLPYNQPSPLNHSMKSPVFSLSTNPSTPPMKQLKFVLSTTRPTKPSSSNSPLQSKKYRHVAAVHHKPRNSCLSHDSDASPSFLGFRNLMVLVLVVMNLRLVVENFIKYGVLICIRCHDYRRQDLILGAISFVLVPCHLLVAFVIELTAAVRAQELTGLSKRQEDPYHEPQDDQELHNTLQSNAFALTWRNIAWAHILNSLLCVSITSWMVYGYIHHPLIGTICELHAIIVFLKIYSYAFTNRDLRHALCSGSSVSLPTLYSRCPYPRNLTLGNLSYFWWAPTLVYQPVYPRTASIRWVFIAKRVAETVGLSMFIWLVSAQYAAPVLRNSFQSDVWEPAFLVERLMKLSTISLVIWLAGFFAVFQSALNALAEVTRFADREFYAEWWNSASLAAYWRTWNRPVYHFMRRHVYSPLLGQGWSPRMAGMAVFVCSGVLHELAVGMPTHNILGVAFLGMIMQVPMLAITRPLEEAQGMTGKVFGNCIFWISFCLVGQPVAVLLYFSAWQAKYGSASQGLATIS